MACDQGDVRFRFGGLPQGQLGNAVLNDMAKMWRTQAVGIEFHLGQALGHQSFERIWCLVPDRQAAIWRSAHGQYSGPGTQAGQIAFAAGAEGRYPDIRVAVWLIGGGGSLVDQGHADALLAQPGRKCGADHAGAYDDGVKGLCHIRFLSAGLSLRDAVLQTSDRGQSRVDQ